MTNDDPIDTTIFSVGYEGRALDELVALLVAHGIEVLVDVRLTPISRKKGFSKSVLAEALAKAGIEYRHERALGNPKDNRAGFQDGQPEARDRYEHHLSNGAQASYEATIGLARNQQIALLCYEFEHSECHRSSITGRAMAELASFGVVEL